MKNLKILFMVTALLHFNIAIPMTREEELINEGFNPNTSDKPGYYEIRFMTIDNSKDFSSQDFKFIQALDKYKSLGFLDKKFKIKDKQLEYLESLIEDGANINIEDKDGKTLLFFACDCADIKIVKLLLNLKIDINKTNDFGTPLYDLLFKLNRIFSGTPIKMVNKYIKIIKLLIRAGIDYNIKNKFGFTSFYHLSNPNPEPSEKLIIQKIENIINTKQNIIKEINNAIENNDINQVKKILLKGYKYFYDLELNNMLHIAALKNKPQIFLLIFGVLPELIKEKNRNGLTPIDLNPEMIIYLIYNKKNNPDKVKLDDNKKSCNLM